MNDHLQTSTARMLDANFNRAREALRVMEDYARLALNDGTISETTKRLRHDLSNLFRGPPWETLVRSRDIVADVGRHIETESEYRRDDLSDVVAAAGRRLTEALRVIEECCKLIDAAVARQVERIRYDAYELERRLTLTKCAIANFGHVRLYVIVTESECTHHWYETARAAIEGGADCIQLREKHLGDRELLDRSRRLRSLCHERGILFAVNDRLDIAALCDAHVVHVGQDDLSVADARRVCGPRTLVGISTHSMEQVSAAAEQAPDYIAIGPVFSTQLKPHAAPLGVNVVASAAAVSASPIVPIGGIDALGAQALSATGVHCACVCRAIIAADDVRAAAKAIRQAIGGPPAAE